MQGQRSSGGSFHGLERGSVSNSSSTNQRTSWNNMLNPAERQHSSYILSSIEANFTSESLVDHNVHVFNDWNPGESSSNLNRELQIIDDGVKMEFSWSSSFRAHAGAGPGLHDRRLEPYDVLPRESVNVGLHCSHVTNGPSFYSSSSSSWILNSANLDEEYVGGGGNHGKGMQADEHSSVYKSGVLESEQISSATDIIGTSSGICDQFMEENDGGSASSVSWGLSCKRKALEGTSRQLYPAGGSSCFPQVGNSTWHAVPARYHTSGSLNITTPPTNTPIGSPPERLDPVNRVDLRSLTYDAFSSSRAMRNAEITMMNLNRRAAAGHQQESSPFNIPSTGSARHSNAFSPQQSSRPFPFSDPLDVRSAAGAAATTTAPQTCSHVMHIPGFSRNVLPFPWNSSLSSRAGSSSSAANLLGECSNAQQEKQSLRSIPRSNTEHPLSSPASEIRNVAQDPTSWRLATGNVGNPGGAPSSSQIGPGSGVQTLLTPGWKPPAQTLQRLSGWSLLPSVDSESGVPSDPFASFSSGPSSTSQEIMMSSVFSNQRRNQLLLRPTTLLETQGDDAFSSSNPFWALAADFEGRDRIISEIHQVLGAMRRGVHLRPEDYMHFDPSIHRGMAALHDIHQDMRLDVDNMTYEELLALEEHIGDVKTGLSEETILKYMEQRKYLVTSPLDMEPCCICQEKYAAADDLGTLTCGHDFHTDCIKQWLMIKNLCPICRTTALIT